jgi:hypothetical protein
MPLSQVATAVGATYWSVAPGIESWRTGKILHVSRAMVVCEYRSIGLGPSSHVVWHPGHIRDAEPDVKQRVRCQGAITSAAMQAPCNTTLNPMNLTLNPCYHYQQLSKRGWLLGRLLQKRYTARVFIGR